MNYRKSEIDKLKLDTRWLDQVKAKNAYEFALRYSSNKRYGLNEDSVSEVESLIIDSDPLAKQWLNDDAVILHNLNKQIVFYCHENELEIGHRNA